MNRGRLVFLLFSLAVLVPVISGTLSRAASDDTRSGDSLSAHLSIFSEVLSLIRRAYVEETSTDELLAGALDGSTDALDPMATYIPAGEVERYREVRRLGTSHSGVTLARERGICFVVAVDEDSPARRAGLQQGDIVAKVEGRSTRRMPLWHLQSILAEAAGSEVRLELLRRGQPHDLTIRLAPYETSTPTLREIRGISVLRIARFERIDQEALRGVLARLVEQGQERLLIDVRGVAGGAGEVAFAMAGFFAQGALGELRTRDEATLHFQAQEPPLWQGDTVILIDGGTQGAAEVFATVLRQLVASRVVGRRSFGHAGRHRLLPFGDGSQLLLTDAFYRGPDGEPIDHSLDPDVTVSELTRTSEERELSLEELTLERGLEILLAPPAEAVEEVA